MSKALSDPSLEKLTPLNSGQYFNCNFTGQITAIILSTTDTRHSMGSAQFNEHNVTHVDEQIDTTPSEFPPPPPPPG